MEQKNSLPVAYKGGGVIRLKTLVFVGAPFLGQEGTAKSPFLASPSPRSGGGPGEMLTLRPASLLLRAQQPLQQPPFSGCSAASSPGFAP